MTSERNSNEGYIAWHVETNEGTVAGVPNVFGVLYNETLTTDLNVNSDTAIFGNKAARLFVTPGVRSHGGDIEILGEPNTTTKLFDMLLPQGSITGTDPATHPFTHGITKPHSYTVDISMGNQVARFMGVGASEVTPTWVDGKLHWKAKLAALKSFLGAEIASISTDTVTLTAPVNHTAPATGLYTGDIVSIVKASDGTRQNLTVQTVTSTTVQFTSTPSSVSPGDMLIIRPSTPSLDLLDPFTRSRTEHRFASTASSALSAANVPLEDGTEFTISHPFEDDKGAQSFGSYDPSRLVRSKSVDVTFKAKKYFEDPLTEVKNYNALNATALVIRMFSGSQYEFRLTINKLYITKGGDKAMLKVDESLFYEPEYTAVYNIADGQMFDVKVLDAHNS